MMGLQWLECAKTNMQPDMRTENSRSVDLVEEALSSWAASRRLSEAGIPAREQKQRIDSMAACVILESWFATADRHLACTNS